MSFFSNGENGRVYQVSMHRADLMKEERSLHPNHWLLVFYTHLIVNTVFPGTVISVVLSQPPDLFNQIHYYSNKASV